MNTIARVVAMHDASAVEENHVYEVWEDGEITITKGGRLYGMRRLHLLRYGDINRAIPADSMPVQFGRHGCIQVKTDEEATKASNLILNS